MTDPAALVPFKAVAADLLEVAKDLRLVRADDSDGTVAQNEDHRSISQTAAAESIVPAGFPAVLSTAGLYIPPIILEMQELRFIPAHWSSFVPASGDWWYRLIANATSNDADAISNSYPVNITLNEHRFEWIEYSPSLPGNEPGIGYGLPCDYYFYLVRIASRAIVSVTDSVFLRGTNRIMSDPP